MSATLTLGGAEFTIDDSLEWSGPGRGPNRDAILSILSERFGESALPDGYSPSPTLALADLAAEALGGEVTSFQAVDPPEGWVA